MKVNLQEDFEAIFKHVQQRVGDFPVYVNAGPGEDDDPISKITLGYQFDQAGWVALVFDTRPNAEPDGTWQSYIEDNAIEFDHWYEAFNDLMENSSPIELTHVDGKQQTVADTDEESLAKILGEMLRDVLIKARENGEFSKLPLAERCIMGVEEHDGYYGWPDYEHRVKEGFVQ